MGPTYPPLGCVAVFFRRDTETRGWCCPLASM